MSAYFRLAAVALVLLPSQRSPAAEANEPLGGPANEARLKRVIHETVKPEPVVHKPLSADAEGHRQGNWARRAANLAWARRCR